MALLPYMIPAVTGVLAWRWISDGLYGIVNHLLLGWGVIAQPISFATSPGWAMPLVIAASVWQFTPFVVLVVLATLSGIPGTIYEASRIDGTTWWSELRYITLPLLRSAILLIVLLRSIWMFNRFDIITCHRRPARRHHDLPCRSTPTSRPSSRTISAPPVRHRR